MLSQGGTESAAPESIRPGATPGALLRADAIVKRFGGVLALDGVSFDLVGGEIHALCGENGAGKSTLIKVLGGVHPADSYEGTLYVDGAPARFRSVRDAGRAGIAVIHQELALVEEMTVAENVYLGAEPRRGLFVDWDRIVRGAAELFARYDLDVDARALVSELGVGRRQLVEIVRALRANSRVLVLDEPTAALSDRETERLLDVLRGLRKRGVACIYISHRLGEVLALADRITVLRDGKSITRFDARDASEGAIIRAMVGREIVDLFPRRATPPPAETYRVGSASASSEPSPGASSFGEAPLLRVRDLDVAATRSGPLVISGVSFEARAGEVVGIGGLMGAGRTELVMHLFGAFGHRRRGTVEVGGQFLAGTSPREAMAAGLVLVSEDRKRYGLVLEESVRFNLSLSVLRRFAPLGLIDEAAEEKAVRGSFGDLRIKARSLSAEVRELSGGNQQKVVVGKAMLVGPRVVLLDEPTRGIDVGAKVEVYELVNRFTAQGKAVILVSSELPELLGMSDRVLVLHEGSITGAFDRGAASPEKVLAAAMGRPH
jgi:D-xylose transport system ATP-binding protein